VIEYTQSIDKYFRNHSKTPRKIIHLIIQSKFYGKSCQIMFSNQFYIILMISLFKTIRKSWSNHTNNHHHIIQWIKQWYWYFQDNNFPL